MNAQSMTVVTILVCLTTMTPSEGRQATNTADKVSASGFAAVLDEQLTSVETTVVGAAEAMPEEKYGFAPTNGAFEGVRTFAQQVKHIAFTNYGAFASMLGEKPPESSPDENGPDSVKTKDAIMKYLRGSFAVGHRALATVTAENAVSPIAIEGSGGSPATRLELYSFAIGHPQDHYGQMVEYLRMNGIVPPASRPTVK
jgi:uncharacterized damage-inducible protein DinB